MFASSIGKKYSWEACTLNAGKQYITRFLYLQLTLGISSFIFSNALYLIQPAIIPYTHYLNQNRLAQTTKNRHTIAIITEVMEDATESIEIGSTSTVPKLVEVVS